MDVPSFAARAGCHGVVLHWQSVEPGSCSRAATGMEYNKYTQKFTGRAQNNGHGDKDEDEDEAMRLRTTATTTMKTMVRTTATACTASVFYWVRVVGMPIANIKSACIAVWMN